VTSGFLVGHGTQESYIIHLPGHYASKSLIDTLWSHKHARATQACGCTRQLSAGFISFMVHSLKGSYTKLSWSYWVTVITRQLLQVFSWKTLTVTVVQVRYLTCTNISGNKSELPTWCNNVIYWSFFSSTCFGRIRPSSGALEVKLQHMVFCTQFIDGHSDKRLYTTECGHYTHASCSHSFQCRKPYAATEHLVLLMMGVCARNMSS